MDHLIFLEGAWKEIEELLNGTKTMIIQGFDEINEPHWEIAKGDMLYFAYNGGKNEIRARAVADTVFHSGRLSREESYELIIRNQESLMLPDDLFYRWAGKKHLLLIGLSNIELFETEVEQAIKPRQISA
jgi:hypothetical protein